MQFSMILYKICFNYTCIYMYLKFGVLNFTRNKNLFRVLSESHKDINVLIIIETYTLPYLFLTSCITELHWLILNHYIVYLKITLNLLYIMFWSLKRNSSFKTYNGFFHEPSKYTIYNILISFLYLIVLFITHTL